MAVFSSVARRQTRSDSDIDLVVEAPVGTSGLAFVHFKALLEQVLGSKIAKELLHIERWLGRVDEVIAKDEDAYGVDDLLLAAGDLLMMKLGEASNLLCVGARGRA